MRLLACCHAILIAALVNPYLQCPTVSLLRSATPRPAAICIICRPMSLLTTQVWYNHVRMYVCTSTMHARESRYIPIHIKGTCISTVHFAAIVRYAPVHKSPVRWRRRRRTAASDRQRLIRAHRPAYVIITTCKVPVHMLCNVHTAIRSSQGVLHIFFLSR